MIRDLDPTDVRSQRWPAIVGAAVGCIVMLVYLRTLCPTVGFGDSGELQAAVPLLGIPHPPGYPIYVMAAHPLSRLPVGSFAWRVNLWSAVMGVVATLLLFAIALEATRPSQDRPAPVSRTRLAAAALAALAFALSQATWTQATHAEVYTFFAALLAGHLLCGVRWLGTGRYAWLAAATLLLGVYAWDRPEGLLYLPAFVGVIVWAERVRRIRDEPAGLSAVRWLGLFALFLLPGLSLFYIGWRDRPDQPLNYIAQYNADKMIFPPGTPEWQRIAWLVSGRQYTGGLGLPLAEVGSRIQLLASRLSLADLTLPGVLLAAWAIRVAGEAVVRGRPRPRDLATAWLLATAAANTAFYLAYLSAGHEFLLPMLVGASPLVAQGLVVAVQVAREPVPQARARRGMPASTGARRWPWLLAGAIPPLLLVSNWAVADRSHETFAHDYGAAVFADLPRDAVILSAWNTSTVLWYFQELEAHRPDVLVVNREPQEWPPEIARFIGRRRVFLTENDPDAAVRSDLVRHGPLWEARTKTP